MKLYFRKITFLVLFMALSQLMVNFLVVTRTWGQQPVRIVSHAGFLVPEFFIIVGEAVNEGVEMSISNIVLKATLYDGNNQVIDVQRRQTILNVLLVGRKTPFIFYGSKAVQSYDVEIESYEEKPEGKPTRLEILYYDIENGTIWGGIKNIGSSNASFVKVTATFYDNERNIAAMNSDINIMELAANTADVFEISFPFPERWDIYKWCAITTESIEFAATQEINGISLSDPEENGNDPLISVVIIAIAVILIATFLILQRRRKKTRKLARAKPRKRT